MRRNGFVIALTLLSASLHAQDFRATVAASVTAASAPAIFNAKIRAVQVDTAQVTEATSNHDGYYTPPYLIPSTYELEVTAKGFKKLRRENVTLLVAQKLDLDLKLELGAITSEITVRGDVETLQTADANGGLNFDSTMVSEYPLNGRQIYMLLDNTPG